MNKQPKRTTKKKILPKKAVAKRAPSKTKKPVITAKKGKTAAKRAVSKTKKYIPKKSKQKLNPIASFVLFTGVIGLVFLASFAIAGFLSPTKTTDNTVLGATTGMMAPTDFKAMVVDYTVMLSWTNVAEEDYQYVVWVYDSDEKKYFPRKIINESGSMGEIITKSYDQEPGSALLYKVSMCKNCRFTSRDTISGEPGAMSQGVVVRVPRVSAPASLRVSDNNEGVELTWSQSPGVDGYDIWRSSVYFSFFGLFNIYSSGYKKVGTVGTNGTYSSYHAYDADGVPKIPIDVPSPTAYIDKTVAPGKRYRYRITSKKMIVPVNKDKGWQSAKSNGSGSATLTVADLAVPEDFAIKPAAKDRATVSLGLSESSYFSGYYLYCDKCPIKRMKLLSSDDAGVQFGGVDSDKKLMAFSVNGLSENTKYRFSLSKYRVADRRIYESPKTKTVYFTTSDAESPSAPANFSYLEGSDTDEIGFELNIPSDGDIYDYSLSVDCVKEKYAPDNVWKGNPEIFKYKSDDENVARQYRFTLKDFGKKRGTCNANLTAYDPRTETYSEPSVVTFEN